MYSDYHSGHTPSIGTECFRAGAVRYSRTAGFAGRPCIRWSGHQEASRKAAPISLPRRSGRYPRHSAASPKKSLAGPWRSGI